MLRVYHKACLPLAALLAVVACGSPRTTTVDNNTADPLSGVQSSARGAVSIAANGDMLLTRGPAKRIKAYGSGFLFSGIRPLIEAADIAFGNLECPISTGGTPFPNKPPGVTFRAEPQAADVLKEAGYDIVSLANNHMNDYGTTAVDETLGLLDLFGVAHAGAGRNGTEARRAAIVSRSGCTIAFLAYAEPVWSVIEARDPPWPKPLATMAATGFAPALGYGPAAAPGAATDAGGRSGTAIIREDTLRSDIENLRSRPGVDLIVVSFHWGDEFMQAPYARQRRIAQLAIECGADVVLGHHPHVLQGIERYKNGLIFYSLGNFVFDMDPDVTYDSMVVILWAVKDESGRAHIPAFDILPVRIVRKRYTPIPATGEDRRRISDTLKSRSKELGLELFQGCSDYGPLVEGEAWEPSLHWTLNPRSGTQ